MSRKVRVNKAVFGKKLFNSRVELEYYRRYEMLKFSKELVEDIHQAVGRCEGFIPCETFKEELEAWQFMIDTGYAWSFQGWFGRRASWLIQEGLCKQKVVH